jgi:hypothetical protein
MTLRTNTVSKMAFGIKDTQHNDIRNDDKENNDIQNPDTDINDIELYGIQHFSLTIKIRYAECQNFARVIMLSAVMLNVIIASVVAP